MSLRSELTLVQTGTIPDWGAYEYCKSIGFNA
jgi:hypothetical protein